MKKPIFIAVLALVAIALGGCEQESPSEGMQGTDRVAPLQSEDTQTVADRDEHETTGTVTAVDAEAARITVTHEPVPALEWPAMTMQFRVADADLLRDINAGDDVRFVFVQDDAGKYLIQDIRKL